MQPLLLNRPKRLPLNLRQRALLVVPSSLILILIVVAACQGNNADVGTSPNSSDSQVANAAVPTGTQRSTEGPVSRGTAGPTTIPTSQPDVLATPSGQSEVVSTTPQATGTSLPIATVSAPVAEYSQAAVATGPDYTCLLKSDGSVICLGAHENSVPALDVRLKSITSGESHACGIKTDRTIVCWGSSEMGSSGVDIGLTNPPAGEFSSISAGVFHTCGVRTNGTLACWGLNELGGEYIGLADPPDGAFTSVSAGWLHSCGVKTDGSVECWGHQELMYDGPGSPISPPPGEFSSTRVGALHSCGLRTNGELACWGQIAVGPGGDCTFFCFPETIPAEEFELPTAIINHLPDGGGASCGITVDGSIVCWGYPVTQSNPPKGEYSDISIGGSHACGLRTDGAIVCWTFQFDGEIPGAETGLFCIADPEGNVRCPGDPAFEMEAMAQSGRLILWDWYSHDGIDYHCGFRLDDSLVCWTEGQTAFADPVPTEVAAFATSDGDSACWLLPDHTVACWGTIGSPAGTFDSISLGGSHEQFGCGIRTDNSLACWGHYDPPPEGEYKSLSATDGHACAIKIDSTVACWGNVPEGSSCWGNDPEDFQGCIDHMEAGDPWTPLSGTFQAISGSDCGVHTEGHIECEIGDAEGRWWKIEGDFRSVGVGEWGKQYACGLHLDGVAECWGDNAHGRAVPPEELFRSISIAAQHACGVRLDETIACWGGQDTYIGGGRDAVLPPGGTFRSVSVGGRPNHGTHFSCGIRNDGSPSCWGNPSSAVLQALISVRSRTTN